MDKTFAYKVLRLKDRQDSFNKEDIEKSYHKMLRRYPPESFPEKALEIRDAYNFLMNSDRYWSDFLQKKSFNFNEFIEFVDFSKVEEDFDLKIKPLISRNAPRIFLEEFEKTIFSFE